MKRAASGIAFMILTIFLFSIMNALAKGFTTSYSIIEIVWARFLSQTIFTTIIFLPNLPNIVRTKRIKLHLFRSLLLFGATIFMFSGFKYLSLISTMTIFQIGPLIIVIFSVIFLQETAGYRRWLSVIIGFTGTLFILRPGTEMFAVSGFFPILAATFYAGYAVATRRLGTDEDPKTNFFYTSLVGTLISSLILIPFFAPMAFKDFVLFSLLGIFGGLGHFSFVIALRRSEASILAPFTYFDLIFATILGIVFFSEYPDAYIIIGAVIIVSAGIYTWYREKLEENIHD